jgi:integrase
MTSSSARRAGERSARNLSTRGLETAAKRAELGRVNFHALAAHLREHPDRAGARPVFVSRQLGHTNAAITLKVYAHRFDAERHATLARDRLDAEYGSMVELPETNRLDGASSRPVHLGGAARFPLDLHGV